MSETKIEHRYSFPLVGLLTLLFIALKLMGYIAWSWAWVLSPLWIFAIFWLVIVFGAIGVAIWVETRGNA